MTRSAEFDAFGPWVDQVRNATEVPGLYRDFPVDFAASRLVLKVPRNISRRDALPTMDLYDHLIVVAPAALTVLSRTGDTFTEVGVAHDQVAAITDWVNLLDARLVIRTLAGEVVTVAYNGSSNDEVTTLVDLLRRLANRAQPRRRHPAPAALPQLGLDDLGRKDALIVTTFRELAKREPGVRLVAAHGRSAVKSRTGAVARLLDLFVPATLHACAIGISDTELHVVSRREWIVRGGAPVVSRARTVIALEALTGAAVADHPRYLGVSVVTLAAGRARIEFAVPESSDARRVLLAV